MQTITPERKLVRARVSLLRSELFLRWAPLLSVGKVFITDEIPTAATDGYNEYYNPNFIMQMTDKMLAFVVLHENKHKGYRHLITWRKLYERNAQLANQACDFVINLEAVQEDPNATVIEVPKLNGADFICLDNKYKGMDTYQVYKELEKQQQQQQQSGQGGQGGQGGQSLDEHMWEKAKEVGKDKDEAKKQEREVKRALQNGQTAHEKKHGKGKGSGSLEIGDLLMPKVDWKELLRDFVSTTCRNKDVSSWRRVNRRFVAQGMYMPSIIGESLHRLTLAADTSGSIGRTELQVLFGGVSEIVQQVHPEHFELVYWGSRVVGHETYEASEADHILQSTRPSCGGGTDPQVVPDFLKEQDIESDAIIVVTDGYVPDWGHGWDAPVLWIIIDNAAAQPDNGIAIHVSSRELANA